MKIPKVTGHAPADLVLIVGLVAAGGIVLYIASKYARKIADQAGGLVSGNNAITSGTPYAGYGLVATPAAIANAASGGTLQSLGEAIGGKLYDWFGNDPAPELQTKKQQLDGAFFNKGYLQ